MKNFRKIIATLLMLSVTLGGFALGASASAEDGAADEVAEDSAVTDEVGTADGDEGIEGNPFGELYAMALENADKIFSALAFVGTLILAFAYKKGLLPTVSRAISGISAIAKAAKEETDRSIAEGDVRLAEVSAGLERTVDVLAVTEAGVSRIEERLAELESVGTQAEALKAILSSQIDMLYDIFMASSIPEYQKEAVGIRVMEMRKELNADECGNKK